MGLLGRDARGNGVLAMGAFPCCLQHAKGSLKLHLRGSVFFVVVASGVLASRIQVLADRALVVAILVFSGGKMLGLAEFGSTIGCQLIQRLILNFAAADHAAKICKI